MRTHRRWRLVCALLIATAFAIPAVAQQPETPAPAKPAVKPRPKPKAEPKAEPKSGPAASAKPAEPAAAVAGGGKATLVGQFGEWGAYTAVPGGKKVCFAIAKPTSSETVPPNRPRNPIYMFISTRPAEKVLNEVSIIVGYPFKPGSEATAEVGTTTFALYTQQDGAWIKNAAEEAHMVDAMRQGQSAIVKGMSSKGTKSSDTFSLKGLAQALDRTAEECK